MPEQQAEVLKQHRKWLRGLRAGSRVIVRKPWFDKVTPGGERHEARVTKRVRTPWIDHIHVEGFGVFQGSTGKHDFNTFLEAPDAERITPPMQDNQAAQSQPQNTNEPEVRMAEGVMVPNDVALTADEAAAIGGVFLAQLRSNRRLVEPVRFTGGQCFTTTSELILDRWDFFGPIQLASGEVATGRSRLP